jgi:serine/threonine protein kinase
MAELNDEDCIETVRDFVRNNPDIEVTEYIRRGCNGEVYFGKRKKLNDDVVLKFYWSHNANYDETEEAVTLQKIKHNNILQLFDLRFLPPNFAYFLTPKIQGGDLQHQIENKKFSTKESLEIISGILMGITELHSQHKLVHRDLKPGNILVDCKNNRAIVADLGAVKKIHDANGHVTASKSTYLYLPPEAINENKYFFQSDIYQIGIILFQLLGGFFPINDQEKWLTEKENMEFLKIKNSDEQFKFIETTIGKKICKGKFIDLNTLPEYLDESYKRVLSKALSINHNKRYQNSAEFLKAIHNLINANPSYIEIDEHLLVSHNSGKKEFKIYKNKKEEYVLEKRLNGKDWRRENSHDGTYKSILKIARQK